jgi:hypothetical protein
MQVHDRDIGDGDAPPGDPRAPFAHRRTDLNVMIEDGFHDGSCCLSTHASHASYHFTSRCREVIG